MQPPSGGLKGGSAPLGYPSDQAHYARFGWSWAAAVVSRTMRLWLAQGRCSNAALAPAPDAGEIWASAVP